MPSLVIIPVKQLRGAAGRSSHSKYGIRCNRSIMPKKRSLNPVPSCLYKTGFTSILSFSFFWRKNYCCWLLCNLLHLYSENSLVSLDSRWSDVRANAEVDPERFLLFWSIFAIDGLNAAGRFQRVCMCMSDKKINISNSAFSRSLLVWQDSRRQ